MAWKDLPVGLRRALIVVGGVAVVASFFMLINSSSGPIKATRLSLILIVVSTLAYFGYKRL